MTAGPPQKDKGLLLSSIDTQLYLLRVSMKIPFAICIGSDDFSGIRADKGSPSKTVSEDPKKISGLFSESKLQLLVHISYFPVLALESLFEKWTFLNP